MVLKNKKVKIILIIILSVVVITPFIVWAVVKYIGGDQEQTALDKYKTSRNDMVNYQIISRGIEDEKVLDIMRKVLRHEFVDENYKDVAYIDRPLPIVMGQTISAPYIVALMTESLELTGDEKVLEIGTGSGYQTAVLAEIVKEVYTVEIITYLHEKSNKVLSDYSNITTSNHDGFTAGRNMHPLTEL